MGEAKRRKKKDPNWGQQTGKFNRKSGGNPNKNPIASKLISLIIDDENLSIPIFIEEIRTEQDIDNYNKQLPLVYVWSNKQYNNSFNVSVNGKLVGGILELFCERNDPSFVEIRNEVLTVISDTSRDLVSEICRNTGKLPSEIFAKRVSNDKEFKYEDWGHLRLAKALLKDAIESKSKEKVERYLDTLVYLIDEGKKEVVAKILSDSLTEVNCDAFFWHIKTYNPEADIPDEAMLKDAMASKGIKMMIQDGLIFGEEFSFYKDENGNRHITISPDAMDKMKPETLKYINEVTDANL